MQISLGGARSPADAPSAGKQNGLLGKLAWELDGYASRIFFSEVTKNY